MLEPRHTSKTLMERNRATLSKMLWRQHRRCPATAVLGTGEPWLMYLLQKRPNLVDISGADDQTAIHHPVPRCR